MNKKKIIIKKIILLYCLIIAVSMTACTVNDRKAKISTDIFNADSELTVNEKSISNEVALEIDSILEKMTLEEKVWQMFFVAPEDIIDAEAVVNPDDSVRRSIEDCPVGGIILFGKNIQSKEQVKNLNSKLKEFSKLPLFVAVDEEGGRVARLGNADIGVPKIPSMAQIGASNDAQEAYNVGITLGKELTDLDFNVDFAPVADVMVVGDNEDIGNRSFGRDPKLVADMVAAEVKGMNAMNLCSTLKHFPSNGSAVENTHTDTAVCYRTLDEMRESEFIPFKAGIENGATFVMVSHMSVPSITGSNVPSTLSPVMVNDILRKELGFKGIILSDALNMGAITNLYSSTEAVLSALDAGIDMFLMSPDVKSAVAAIIEGISNGRISEDRIDESIHRILMVKMNL